jgi:hypothetical protein
MEDKYVKEALAILEISPSNPLVKNSKHLLKLKIEIAKALVEAGTTLTLGK